MTTLPTVDLSNCALEPIHIPGSIQPHGVLLAFTPDGGLVASSANATSLLGSLPEPGAPLTAHHATEDLRAQLASCLQAPGRADAFDIELPDGSIADVSVHFHQELLIAEIEPRHAGAEPPAKFAIVAQRALDRIQSQHDLDSLLIAGVEEIALLSGFDRVMAYRFHPDDSGEVVVERMARPLDPYQGMRYPATDIPAQARRLFAINPVRLIPDVAYEPVPVTPDHNPVTGGPIDLSHAALRSVSPIHVEYLTNMGVRASLCVSIVVGDRLWGMFACHHYAPRLVSPAVRLTCRLLSQVASVAVQRFEATQHADRMARARHFRSAIAERAQADDDLMRALTAQRPAITDLLRCAGAAVTSLTQIGALGETPSPEGVAAVADWLAERAGNSFVSHHLAADAPELATVCTGFAGLAAIRFSAEPRSYIVWFRREQVETLRWAGDPGKVATIGPLGERLSPRGSFAEWKEEVRGRSEQWAADDLEAIEDLRRALVDITAVRLQEAVRTREMLLAMLGHDLRSPLQAIAMAGEVLGLDHSRAGLVQKQIANISGRMGRLINHVLDLSRLQTGTGLIAQRTERDVGELLRDVIAENRAGHPDVEIVERQTPLGTAAIDADRIAQVLGNLISNARHHGVSGAPIVLEGERRSNEVVIRVINRGAAISAEALQSLFEPFKRGSLDNPANPRGLGLGLYIASSIVREHGGALDVSSSDGLVTFTVTLPAAPPD